MPKQKIIKIGNSLGVTLPARFIQNLSLKVGDKVELSQTDDNSLLLHFLNNPQLSHLSSQIINNTQK